MQYQYRKQKQHWNFPADRDWKTCSEEDKAKLEKMCPRKFEFKLIEKPKPTPSMVKTEKKPKKTPKSDTDKEQ